MCPVCFWEDDGQDDHDARVVRGGANYDLSLEVARQNFSTFGACDRASLERVRSPSAEEVSGAGDRVMELPYLRLMERDGRLPLRVEDVELSDFIEDYLIETCDFADLAPTFGEVTEIIFPEGVAATTVVASLRKLNADELERIFRINNPSIQGEDR